MKLTGERVVPDEMMHTGPTYTEHIARYTLASFFCQNKTVLDIACGAGYGSKFISETAHKVFGVDVDPETIDYAKARYAGKNIFYSLGDAGKRTCFDDGLFDVVVSFETIEHLTASESDVFLKEMKRVMKVGGLLIISTPIICPRDENGNLMNKFHKQGYTFDSFSQTLSNHFSDIKFLGQETNSSEFNTKNQKKALYLIAFARNKK